MMCRMGIQDDVRRGRHELRGEAYEEFIGSAYLTAVRLGVPTREGLRGAGLSDDEVDVSMGELTARGLLVHTTDPDVWEVLPPREAMTRQAEVVERRIALSRATAAEVETLWRRAVGERIPVSNQNFEALVGLETVAERILSVHRASSTRLWVALDPSPAVRMFLEAALEDESLLLLRPGVEARMMFDTALLEQPAAMAHLERCDRAGHPVRVGNGIPFTTVLVDSRAGLIDLSTFDQTGQGSAELRGPGPLGALEKLLDEIWQLSTPYGPTVEAARREEGQKAPLDTRDLRILHLLSAGASDQLIARQLGVSVRTVERRIRYLTEHLGAATRFQAGVQAVRRGWV